MKIACLSGKGGAGKTFVAVNLAAASGKSVYIDCDVEEPNGRLFFKPEIRETIPVYTLLPSFDSTKCTGCKECVKFCRFNALVYVKEKPMVFSEVCHSCGGCLMVCPEGAISEEMRRIGQVDIGMSDDIRVVTGVLDPGEASGVPVIKEALKHKDEVTVIDCPPGSACTVMESIEDADICILVAEPTAFGFHNFTMVHELVSIMGKKAVVVINKEADAYEPLERYCADNRLQILARIPYNSDFAKISAAGGLLIRENTEAAQLFSELLEKVRGVIE